MSFLKLPLKPVLDKFYAAKEHLHGNVTDDGKIEGASNKNVVTDANGKITTENKPTIPSASSTTPSADTTNGSVGLGTTWAKADHTHPKSTIYSSSDHNHDGTYLKTGTGTVTSTNIANKTIVNEDISDSANIAFAKLNISKNDITGLGIPASDTNTTYTAATQSADGLMSSSDKTKLDGIATGANKTTVDSSLSSSSTNPVQNKVINTALSGKAASTHNHTKSEITDFPTDATTSTSGLMSSTDKTKLDGIATSANNYSHPSYTARTGKPTANQTPAFGGTATVSQITSDATGHVTGATDRTITIPSTTATTSAAGLMSSTDKTKLDGVATGANKTTVDTALSSTSTNPVQNKVINTAISNLQNGIANIELIEVVTDLPTTNISTNKLYFKANNTSESENLYDIFAYVGDNWEHIDALNIDISEYLKKADLGAGTGLTKSGTTLGITNGGVGATQLASNAVETAKIKDANVTTAKIADSAVTSAKIADGTIVNGDIANTTIQGGKLVNGTITATQLASNAVETAKIKDANVTNAKLADQTNTVTEYIVGTQTASTSAWTGKATKISSLAAGQVIYYKLPYASTSTAVTLNLTLANGTTTTGAKNVFFWNGQRLTTHYGVNSVIGLVYNGSEWWVINPSSNANNNNYYLVSGVQITNGEDPNASTPINFASGNIIGAKKDGKYYKLVNGLVLDVSYPLVAANGAINAGATNNNIQLVHPFLTTTGIGMATGTITANYPLYLEGTYSRGQFTVSAIVCDNSTHSTLTNGKNYIRLGTTYDATHFRFVSNMTVYRYDSSAGYLIPIGASYTDLANKPSSFTPSSHTHASSDVTGLTASKNVVTGSDGKLTTENKPTIPTGSSTATDIKMNGTQSAGSSANFAKADHVHPVDTSRVAVAQGNGNANKTLSTDGSGNVTVENKNNHSHYDNQISYSASLAGAVTPIDLAAYEEFNANRLAFLPPANITIKYSTTGVTGTWTDYGASNADKTKLVSLNDTSKYPSFLAGKGATASTNNALQIILDAGYNTTNGSNVYVAAKKMFIYFSTGGATGCKCQIDVAYYNAQTTFTQLGTWNMSGYSGWNSIPFNKNFGGMSSQMSSADRVRYIRLTFWNTTGNYNFAVKAIKMIGENAWIFPSNLSVSNHMYTYDENQNVTFPAKIIKSGGTSSQFLKADGSVDSNTYSTTSHTHNYLPTNANGTTTGTLTATKFINSSSNNTNILLGNGNTLAQSTFATSGHTHSYLPLSGGALTGAVTHPQLRINSVDNLPYAGAFTWNTNWLTTVKERKALIGTVADGNSLWWNVLSVRHRNGSSDGTAWGMYLKSMLTNNGDLIWQQDLNGNSSVEKTILDTNNISYYVDDNFCLYIDAPSYERTYKHGESLNDLLQTSSSRPLAELSLVLGGLQINSSTSTEKAFFFPVVNPTSLEYTYVSGTHRGFYIGNQTNASIFWGFGDGTSWGINNTVVTANSVSKSTTAIAANDRIKIAFESGKLNMYRNGTLELSCTVGTALDDVSEYYIGFYTNNGRKLVIKDVTIK